MFLLSVDSVMREVSSRQQEKRKRGKTYIEDRIHLKDRASAFDELGVSYSIIISQDER